MEFKNKEGKIQRVRLEYLFLYPRNILEDGIEALQAIILEDVIEALQATILEDVIETQDDMFRKLKFTT